MKPRRPRNHPRAMNLSWTPPLQFAAALVAIHVAIQLTGQWWPTTLQQALILRPLEVTEGAGWLAILGHALVHSDWGHLLMNSAFLLIFATATERGLRRPNRWFWFAVFGAGVAAGAFAQWAWWSFSGTLLGTNLLLQSAIGASGGVSALLATGTYASGGVRTARAAALGWLAINLAFALFQTNIAWAAHLGGFVGGLALAPRLRPCRSL